MQQITNDSMPLISVVIPAYNVENYIEECIRSLVCQTYTNFELILVCQISEDRTLQIIQDLASEYDMIHVMINQERGVSLARNHALMHARGEYIAFVDADDWVDRHYLSDLYTAIQGYELAICGYARARNTTDCIPQIFSEKDRVYDQVRTIELILSDNSIGSYLWNKLFRAELIRDYHITFDHRLIIGEDMKFLIEYIQHVNQSQYCPKVEYYYRYNPSSALRRMYQSHIAERKKLESGIRAARMCRSIMMDYSYAEWSTETRYSVLEYANYRIMRSALWAYYNSLKCNYYDRFFLKSIQRWIKGTWNSYRKSRYSKPLEKAASLGILIAPAVSWKAAHLLVQLLPKRIVEKYVNE